MLCVLGIMNVNAQLPGALNGLFTINSSGNQVYFSQGNLQYIGSASTPYWKFADHQWDYLGTTTGQNSDSVTVDRDLFGWGTSGHYHGQDCYQPWSTTSYYYGEEYYGGENLTGSADWGYNAISNGGNHENSGWRTPTMEEWSYLFDFRSTPSGIRYAKAQVHNVNGVILLPDNWNAGYYVFNSPNTNWADYSTNVLSDVEWTALEQHGAVFLPAAGIREWNTVNGVGSRGCYWSASSYRIYEAYYVLISSGGISPYESHYRSDGYSVRLVRDNLDYSFINATPNPAEGGTVSGMDAYVDGATCTLTATPSANYSFVSWTENGEVVSTDAAYTFTVWDDRTLVANFQYNISEGFVGGVFSVGENTTVLFSQGNLQYQASTNTWQFAEHQYDYVGDANSNISQTYSGWIDLFGWGTSGYNHGANCYQPWSTSTSTSDYFAYHYYNYNLFDQTGQADWGYNPISNGGNHENGGWRTLTDEEWIYLFETRNTPSGIRYAKAIVNDVTGVILLPDNWSSSYYLLYSTNLKDVQFNTNVINEWGWTILEQHGAVFLPAAGYRQGSSVYEIGSSGKYWSASRVYASSSSYGNSYSLEFYDSHLNSGDFDGRNHGFSVRLVRSSHGIAFVNATPNQSGFGTVTGGGACLVGAECTLTATANEGCYFVNWTENGEEVSTDAEYTFTVTGDRTLVANFNVIEGFVSGVFSVDENTTVLFSQGNLQYIGSASTPYWKFADHQWDYMGTTTGQDSDSQTVDRDLFGWGTSGYNHGAVCYQPWSTSNLERDYYAYGSSNYNLYDQTGQADWGYNPISNGGNQENSGWRTLTHEEWVYLIKTRNTPSGIRYAKACVNDVNGMILLPDDWNTAYYVLDSTNTSNASYTANIITAENWTALEQYGAVFLPASGYRSGTSVGSVGQFGNYWSATYYTSSWINIVEFSSSSFNANVTDLRYRGLSVRLVRSSQGIAFVNAMPNPSEFGSVSGGGACIVGTECTLTATPNEGYHFVNWTENGEVVSTDANYTFTVTSNRSLVANFQYNVTEGFVNGVFSVGENTTVVFSQGNLQYKASTNTWQFAEHQYDYVGDANSNISQTYNGWIDMFGWGTSGYNHGAVCYQPWSTSNTNSDYYVYDCYSCHLFDQTGQADWGYNAISNGGSHENSGWRTPTHEEWSYLFNTRSTISGIRYAKAKVNNVNGVILLPDNWSADYYTLNRTNISNASFSSNVISVTNWSILEQYGAVFLPAAGDRTSATMNDAGDYGCYWSASRYNENSVNDLYFYDSYLDTDDRSYRLFGFSVRLIRPCRRVLVYATPNPIEGGSVSGFDAYVVGTECTFTATPNEGYTFANWMVDGEVVSTDAEYTFTVLDEMTLVANFQYNNVTEGFVNGVFSLGENTTVLFSKGNLQYQATTNTWQFAEHQYDYVGSDNSSISQTNSGWIDLFGWGTSGYDHGANCYQPWSTSQTSRDFFAYGSDTYNLYDRTGQADWGYNAISNGGNHENSGWRTPTVEEWVYLFETRTTIEGIRYAKAQVNNVNGVILLPDDWSADYYDLYDVNSSDASYSTNEISATEWATLEQYGAVFLPAAGFRFGTSVNDTGSVGHYWLASFDDSYDAKRMYFDDSYLFANFFGPRYSGFSVRLIRPYQEVSYINATPFPTDGGSVNGVGVYLDGTECTLTATASSGYTFVNWTEDGEVVSADAEYTFTVTGNRTLVANFQYNVTEGFACGKFSVGENTTVLFSQGNLQYQASTNTWQFAENQYDYVGDDNSNISQTYDGWIDLLGWGTSGYNHGANCYQPWSHNKNVIDYYAYGNSAYNLYDQTGQADWGYNAISNGGNHENSGWRTPTHEEWSYLFNTRVTLSGIRYAKAQVNNVNGVVLLPDDWSADYYPLSSTNTANTDFTTNVISDIEWTTLEQHGAVFLPVAGVRSDTWVGSVLGYYWSASSKNTSYAFTLEFTKSILDTDFGSARYSGQSVRLVRSSEGYSIVNATPNPAEGGSVSGAAAYIEGAECTLTATASSGFIFANWTEDGEVVSTDAEYTFTVTDDRMLVANFKYNVTEGFVKGIFSVGENATVRFSRGNLQYQASTNTWKFAEHQYDYVGDDNSNISQTNSGWIDLFGWGTSGYNYESNSYYPWSTSYSYYDYFAYGSETYNLFDQTGQADWGYNAISNGGNQENSTWRTPTREEWSYLLNTRSTTSGIRYAKAQVNNVNGVILLPDDWSAGYYTLNNTNTSDASFSTNVISVTDWAVLEQHGAVFLPAAGTRSGTSVSQVGSYGNYWSASCYDDTSVWGMHFSDSHLNVSLFSRIWGRSVRLVADYENTSVSQVVMLSTGWNWFSSYIDPGDPIVLLDMLKEALGDNAIEIQSYDDNTEYYDGEWFGGLDDTGITNDQMYMILVANDCTIELEGPLVDPADYPITIHHGWNWIGFPYHQEVEIAVAFADFDAEEGDVIQTCNDQTEFDGDEWFGDIETLVPGQGVMYFSNSEEVKILVFPSLTRKKVTSTYLGMPE